MFGGWQAGRQSRFLGDSWLTAGLNHPFPPASFFHLKKKFHQGFTLPCKGFADVTLLVTVVTF